MARRNSESVAKLGSPGNPVRRTHLVPRSPRRNDCAPSLDKSVDRVARNRRKGGLVVGRAEDGGCGVSFRGRGLDECAQVVCPAGGVRCMVRCVGVVWCACGEKWRRRDAGAAIFFGGGLCGRALHPPPLTCPHPRPPRRPRPSRPRSACWAPRRASGRLAGRRRARRRRPGGEKREAVGGGGHGARLPLNHGRPLSLPQRPLHHLKSTSPHNTHLDARRVARAQQHVGQQAQPRDDGVGQGT